MTTEEPKKRSFLSRMGFGSKSESKDESPEEKPAQTSAEASELASQQASNPASTVPAEEANPAEEAPVVTAEDKSAEETVEQIYRPEESDQTPEPEPEPEKKGWFSRLKEGLSKSSSRIGEGITGIFTKRKLDDETIEELEDVLISADLGVDTATRITDRLTETRYDKEISPDEVRQVLAEEVKTILEPVAKPLVIDPSNTPHVILMVGVNGAGKTTTIGKLTKKFISEGKKVMLAAGDTFRAAAVEQLKVWGERTGAPVIARNIGADAAGLAYDAVEQAKAQNMDVLLIDTAGRLQNKSELMDELEKIIRVIKKVDENAPHSVLLVLDATTGQNAMNQVEIFGKTAGVTGLVMTKLDGTARGGILVAISAKHALPVHAIGVGESVEDLQPFDAAEFAEAIATA